MTELKPHKIYCEALNKWGAEVKHGKWIEVQKENIWNDIVPVLECSACGKYTVGTRGIMTKSNYCPNCGAKMGAEG